MFAILLMIVMVLGLALGAKTLGKIPCYGRKTIGGLANTSGGAIHPNGLITLIPDVQIATKYLLGKIGSDAQHVDLCGVGDIPLGVIQDSTDTAGATDLVTGLAVAHFGSASATRKVAINSNVAKGDLLVPGAGSYAKTLPTGGQGKFYVFGKALQAGGAGDVIEFDPILPVPQSGIIPIATGVASALAASTSDTIPVTGLVVGDTVQVTLAAQGASEVLVKAIAAAGQINVTLSANATIGTTKYNYTVLRAANS